VTKKTKLKAQKKAEEDANLNEALVDTFPASDPLSMTQPRTGADVPTWGNEKAQQNLANGRGQRERQRRG
jgi:hypothetical protein